MLSRAENGLDGDLFDSGGMPLSDRGAEEQLIGYLLQRPAAVTEVIEIVHAGDFCDPFNRRIYEILRTSYERGDAVTVDAVVRAMGGDDKAVVSDGLTVGNYIAHLISDADMDRPPDEVADHINMLAERRAIGTADDVDFREPFKSAFGGLRWEEIGAAGGADCYSWIVESIIPRGEIVLAFGDSGTGKSFNILDLCGCVARGVPFNGRNVEPGLVFYVAAEAGKGFAKRKIAYSIGHELQPDIALPFYLTTKRPDFFTTDADFDKLVREIEAVRKTYSAPLVLIVIDTLSAIAPGMNENASQDVSRVRARLVRLQELFPDAAIILVHHKPKNGSTPRGHGSLTADFETTIEFAENRKGMDGEPILRAIVQKQREGKKGIWWDFTLQEVRVGVNKWGHDETSCYVLPMTAKRAAEMVGFHATPNELLFMRALFDALIEHGQSPPAGLPPSIMKAVDIRYVRDLMESRMISADADADKSESRFRVAFKRAADTLRNGAVIGVEQPLIWYTGKPVRGIQQPIDVTEM